MLCEGLEDRFFFLGGGGLGEVDAARGDTICAVGAFVGDCSKQFPRFLFPWAFEAVSGGGEILWPLNVEILLARSASTVGTEVIFFASWDENREVFLKQQTPLGSQNRDNRQDG